MTSFDDLQTLWRTADDPPPPVDPDRIAALRSEAARFDRSIRWRDWRETAAAGIVAAAFGGMWPDAPLVGRIGIVLAIAGAGLVVAWMWRAQRLCPRPAPDLTAAGALRIALGRVDVQIDLLRSILWWYLLPLTPGPLVFMAGVYLEVFAELPADPSLAVIAFLAALCVAPFLIVGGVFGFIYWLNQRAVRTDLLPLRNRFATLLHDLSDHD